MEHETKKPELSEFVERLVEIAEKATEQWPQPEVFYALIAAGIRFAAGHARASTVAGLLRGLALDVETVDRAHTPVDPTKLN
jgi:hypothetical protein